MKIVIFGLTISSSWGNGHATLWRGLCKYLARLGHSVVFYERDVSYYAAARDMFELPGGRLQLFSSWSEIEDRARADVADADAAVVTSYCPDAIAATDLILQCGHALPVFYDLDTPITMAKLKAGQPVPYIGASGLRDFKLVLSFTGGPQIADEFRQRLGAENVRPLYGHVDGDAHYPAASQPHYRAALSYLGTYSEDRQRALEALFVAPAHKRQDLRFLIGGAQYPDSFPWSPNVFFVRHLPPAEHPPFFASSRLTLNVTRPAMSEMGWCPSGRLFEAAACGVPLISDAWMGIEEFLTPGDEILLGHDAQDVLEALDMSDSELQQMAQRARERILVEHSSERRARELDILLEQAARRDIDQPLTAEA
ncbi:CgeB family protein [Bradyrhizobium embrapense]|uniref:CgeB family protein n=1 Tax=Bradyrhizobium embrapense TaxID=630921 RepID=UPI00067DA064|nr:glycosyltransferase [Bradyrhizobium embrapense]